MPHQAPSVPLGGVSRGSGGTRAHRDCRPFCLGTSATARVEEVGISDGVPALLPHQVRRGYRSAVLRSSQLASLNGRLAEHQCVSREGGGDSCSKSASVRDRSSCKPLQEAPSTVMTCSPRRTLSISDRLGWSIRCKHSGKDISMERESQTVRNSDEPRGGPL